MEKSSNEIKAEIMLEELKLKYQNINGVDSDENIIKKIIELNFDENAINNYYNIEKIYYELDDEYGISGFIEREDAKKKIKELHCDRDEIVDWIENNLLNGDHL